LIRLLPVAYKNIVPFLAHPLCIGLRATVTEAAHAVDSESRRTTSVHSPNQRRSLGDQTDRQTRLASA